MRKVNYNAPPLPAASIAAGSSRTQLLVSAQFTQQQQQPETSNTSLFGMYSHNLLIQSN
jgi:hypothetical protein